MATKPKENQKGIAELQKYLLSGKTEIKSKELSAMGFDLSNRNFTVRNIKLGIDISGSAYLLSLADNQKDLDGNPIAENEKLMTRVQTLWEAGKRKITNMELADFNIYPAAMSFDIGNVRLNSFLNLTNSYDFEVINAEKDISGKWLDSAVTTKRVIDTLLKFPFTKEQADLAEVPLNKLLEVFFKLHFKTVKRSDTSLPGLLDLTVGSGKTKIAIELKKAEKIKTTTGRNNCRSQIEDYHRNAGVPLIFLVAGHKHDMEDRNVSACFQKAQELGLQQFRMQV